MYTVYAIRSEVRAYTYVGLTNNLARRLAEHNGGQNRTTKPYGPFVLIYSKQFPTRSLARAEEKRLKSGFGKEFLHSLV